MKVAALLLDPGGNYNQLETYQATLHWRLRVSAVESLMNQVVVGSLIWIIQNLPVFLQLFSSECQLGPRIGLQ